MTGRSTIVAVSSGGLPSGVAVIRVSGPQTVSLLKAIAGPRVPPARKMSLRVMRTAKGAVLDRGLVVFFPGPNSFTGEDCAEFHIHGSRAVVSAVLRELTGFDDVQLAGPGDFTKRAYEAGKLDLTQVEGLSDLLAAETESQRLLALERSSGVLRDRIAGWRLGLTRLRATIEAQLDFSDEGDVPDILDPVIWAEISALAEELDHAAARMESGRIVKDGFRVVIAGPPNAGKSSLLNALSGRDEAIVSDEAGTTRDVKEVQLDLNGQLVILTDVAGLRETQSAAETLGIGRALAAMSSANLVFWLEAPDAKLDLSGWADLPHSVSVYAKADLGVPLGTDLLRISSKTGEGLQTLLEMIKGKAEAAIGGESLLLSRARDREAVLLACAYLRQAKEQQEKLEMLAEDLRAASDALGRLTGEIGAEEVLDVLFSGFCIGK